MTVHPSTLFGSGEYGYAFDPTDTTKVWQNVAGTTAGAATSPVGKLDDISGNGKHFTAAADNTTRPTLQSDGTILFDGSNDQLRRSEAGLFAAGACTVVALIKGATTGGKYFFVEGSSSTSNPVYTLFGTINAGGARDHLFARRDDGTNNLDSNSGDMWDTTLHTVIFEDTGSAMSVTVDGVLSDVRSYTRSGTTTLNQTSLGALWRTSIASWMSVSMGRMVVIGRTLTSTEKTDMSAWVVSNAAADAGGSTLSGAATLSGSGTQTAAATATRAGLAAMSGSGTLAALAGLILPGASALTGDGSLTATAGRTTRGAAALSGQGDLTAIASRSVPATASLSGSGTATIAARLTLLGSTALDGAGTLTAAGTLSSGLSGAASLAGSGALAAIASVTRHGTATMQGAGAISASLSAQRAGQATLAGSGGLSALTRLEAGAAAVLSAAGTLTAVGRSEAPRLATVSRPGGSFMRRPAQTFTARPRAVSTGRR